MFTTRYWIFWCFIRRTMPYHLNIYLLFRTAITIVLLLHKNINPPYKPFCMQTLLESIECLSGLLVIPLKIHSCITILLFSSWKILTYLKHLIAG